MCTTGTVELKSGAKACYGNFCNLNDEALRQFRNNYEPSEFITAQINDL
jgi:hypothetical protein